jgi:hypothetical protein
MITLFDGTQVPLASHWWSREHGKYIVLFELGGKMLSGFLTKDEFAEKVTI